MAFFVRAIALLRRLKLARPLFIAAVAIVQIWLAGIAERRGWVS